MTLELIFRKLYFNNMLQEQLLKAPFLYKQRIFGESKKSFEKYVQIYGAMSFSQMSFPQK